jgi:hypothetical protein
LKKTVNRIQTEKIGSPISFQNGSPAGQRTASTRTVETISPTAIMAVAGAVLAIPSLR